MPSKNTNSSTLLSWVLICSSIFSCCCRADYNIIIGFLILFLRSQYTNDKFKLLTKAIIHILVLSLFFDIIWIWQYTSFWSHGKGTSDLWKSLSFVHNFTYYLGIIEFLLKCPALYILFRHFKAAGGNNAELLSLSYMSTRL